MTERTFSVSDIDIEVIDEVNGHPIDKRLIISDGITFISTTTRLADGRTIELMWAYRNDNPDGTLRAVLKDEDDNKIALEPTDGKKHPRDGIQYSLSKTPLSCTLTLSDGNTRHQITMSKPVDSINEGLFSVSYIKFPVYIEVDFHDQPEVPQTDQRPKVYHSNPYGYARDNLR